MNVIVSEKVDPKPVLVITTSIPVAAAGNRTLISEVIEGLLGVITRASERHPVSGSVTWVVQQLP